MITVAHVVEDFSPKNGGITAAVREIMALTKSHELSSEVFAVGNYAKADNSCVRTVLAPLASYGRAWRCAPSLRSVLQDVIKTGAIAHVHGLWMYPQWITARECAVRAHPFVVTPHNMLGGWLWRRGMIRRIKKAAYWKLMAYPAFRHAAVVHALTEIERDILRNGYFESQRIEVIPNSVDVNEADIRAPGQTIDTHRPYLLFLGRLHPVKGLELLIDAFGRIPSGLELWICGSGDDASYEATIRERARRNRRSNSIRFLGVVDGEEKWRLLKGAWCLCAPSYSEGLSMSALESLACGTPVITTPGSGLSDAERGGGIMTEPTVEAIDHALRSAADWNVESRRERGLRARGVAVDTYAPAVVGPKYIAMYRSLMN